MIASLLILLVSLVLLLYWFRYTCLLLLEDKPAPQHAETMVRANRLTYPNVQNALAAGAGESSLDALYRFLDNDYRVVLYLLRHSGLEIPALERRLLVADYRVMQCWYTLVRRCSAGRARQALLEMSRVLGYLSGKMGERAAQNAAA